MKATKTNVASAPALKTLWKLLKNELINVTYLIHGAILYGRGIAFLSDTTKSTAQTDFCMHKSAHKLVK